MTGYVIRRLLYAIPILLGVNLITFFLFFIVNTPDDMARVHLGDKRVSREQIERWKRERNYHLPYFYNSGWSREWLRETSGDDWLSLPALTPGEFALEATLAQGSVDATLILVTDPPGALEPTSPWTESPAGGGALRLLLGPEQPGRAGFRVGARAAEARVRVQLPSGAGPATLVLLQRRSLTFGERFTRTIFFQKSVKFLWFEFGVSDDGRPIGREILRRIPPSLAVTLPVFLIGLVVQITVAMMLAYFRGTYLDFWGVIFFVVLMSVSIMFYVIGGQWLLAKTLRLVPVSGFDAGFDGVKFILLPVAIGVLGAVGEGSRWYRTIFLEEINRDYVRTARSKGLPEWRVLFKHSLKNAMIPILTGVVITLPFLFIGSLVLESFFSIPGMGSFMLEAIQRQDFSVVQAMVFLGSVLYVIGMILTDISYTLVDPRVRLK